MSVDQLCVIHYFRPNRQQGIDVWLRLLLVPGLSVVNANEVGPDESHFWANDRWGFVTMAVLVIALGVMIVALLIERRTRLKAESWKSERRADLMHTSRLAVVGQLSASIGHEINQPLGAILSNADAADLMLATSEPDLDEIRLILTDIRKDSLRASRIVRQIEALARKQPLDFREINLQDLCKDVLHLIAPLARGRGVAILTNFDSHVPLVRGDPILLQQAMLNLLLNAMDALTDAPESQAVIELSTSTSRHGEIEVVVRDHGNGVSEQHLNQLFDAFFTTKKHGLGLGLPTVRSIIESHGGRIVADNHPEGGTVFCFIIPAADVTNATNDPTEKPI